MVFSELPEGEAAKNVLRSERMINRLVKFCHDNAVDHGFWNMARSKKINKVNLVLSKIALIHSELSELVECIRKHMYAKSDHVPELSYLEEELADVSIRTFDLAGFFKVDLARAIKLKMAYNRCRPYMHGKKA